MKDERKISKNEKEIENKTRVRSEKGSITLLVTVTCILVTTVLLVLVMNLSNKKSSQNRQINKITKQYDIVTEQEMNVVYEAEMERRRREEN